MIEWAWVQRLVEGLKPRTELTNWGNGAVQVGCVQGNVTVVNFVLPLGKCCGACQGGALLPGAEENQP